MTGRGGALARSAGRLLLAVLAVACLVAADAPVYVKQLTLPVDDDGFGYPRGVSVDFVAGEILVCDTRTNRIVIFDQDGVFRFEIPGGLLFSSPRDVVVDPDGFLLLLANFQRRRALVELDFDGQFRREIRPEGLPPDAQALSFSSIAISPTGDRLFLVDDANLVLWILGRDGRVIGSVDLGEGLSANERRDLILGKVDVYGDRVLVAVPTYGQIRTFDFEGYDKGVYGAKGTASCKTAFPTAAALDADGNLVIVDQQRMVLIRWARKGNRCLSEHYGMGNAPGFLYFPADIALDANGRAYVSQGFEGRVQVYEGFAPAAAYKLEPEETREEAAAPSSAEPPSFEEALEQATRRDVERSVRDWVSAWAERRPGEFVNAYSREFIPPENRNRERWARAVEKRFRQTDAIEVLVPRLDVEIVSPDLVRASPVVVPRSNPGLRLMAPTLLLAREGDAWKIVEEQNRPSD